MMILLIALGGAAGSAVRYMLSEALQRGSGTEFPVATLLVNATGSLVLGFLMRYLLDGASVSAGTRALLTTGFCGGYTTFSTFSYETIALIDRGDLRRAAVYVSLSVALSLGGVAAGIGAAKQVVAFQRAGSGARS
ncbi:MAG TPA: fluoride efflux transporter CrcB [Gemmatimonadaceae bacterium]|nr:fluoride efflux transporter CrcB [Gemmatimonadaceae bacterium]